MEKEVIDIFNKINKQISDKIHSFKELWVNADEYTIFKELVFCILTPQSKAKNAWKAVNNLDKLNLLIKGTASEIALELNIVRFKNNKAKYIVSAREQFLNNNSFKVRDKLNITSDVFSKRKWLVKKIKGFGYKEASHFLRNIGFVENITILDRHILRNLKGLKIINEIPTNITDTLYLKIENRMKDYSSVLNIPVEYLDFVFWYKETGEIFK